MSTRELLKQEWIGFRRPGRLIALAVATLSVVAFGLLVASGMHSSCDGPCPTDPTTADGRVVGDRFYFFHHDLGRDGSITARLTSMTGTITYPPPDHDEIVPGLVPWAKAGIIVKDGVRQGSDYAALMMTGSHGVRMQYDYAEDVAGTPGRGADVSGQAPRWLRLSRSGDTITGYESADGRRWSKVGTATIDGLPGTVRVGLFAASPGDLTLRRVALGGAVEEVRFTQAVGVFDHVTVTGSGANDWKAEPVGQMNQTDWEKFHNASGVKRSGQTVTVSSTGDIGPSGNEVAGLGVERMLPGLVIALIIVLVVGARYPTRRAKLRTDGPPSRSVLLVRAGLLAAAVFVTGLAGVGITIPSTLAIVRGNQIPMLPVSALTGVRVTVGLAVMLALCAVLAFALGVLFRRGWAAVSAAVVLVAVPFAVSALPLLPDEVADWMLRLTPAAGFAVQQTLVEYPQVVAHYAPSAGYYPLPGWAGFAVTAAYVLVFGLLARKSVVPPVNGSTHSAQWMTTSSVRD
ncbi:DUF1349 domain-containing protein [Flindersiella endophytica]